MTVSDLIARLPAYPSNARVTLLDPDKRWLLPIEITRLSADGSNREADFIAITADSASDEIEGLANRRPWAITSLYPLVGTPIAANLNPLETCQLGLGAPVIAEKLESQMASYWCYLLEGKHIKENATLDCENDADAFFKAGEMLKKRPRFSSAEVWRQGRFVQKLVREAP
jgi:hypothetical protein